jgi:plasmid maintenance system antidote protein VapI
MSAAKTARAGKTVAEYLAFQLDATTKTQREIAKELGYPNSNVITMFKQGLTRIPIPIAPKLAAAIGIDPGYFLRMCLEEYVPELLPVIEQYVGGLCTKDELEIISVIRKATKGETIKLTKDSEKSLAKWAADQV